MYELLLYDFKVPNVMSTPSLPSLLNSKQPVFMKTNPAYCEIFSQKKIGHLKKTRAVLGVLLLLPFNVPKE